MIATDSDRRTQRNGYCHSRSVDVVDYTSPRSNARWDGMNASFTHSNFKAGWIL